jgi:hypothetical protein
MCRQWVHSLLDGELQLLHSSPGAGSDFALDLPMPEA